MVKDYRNQYPTDAFLIYSDKKSYVGINIAEWIDDESLYVYVSQEADVNAFTEFFMRNNV